jgi:hypothetical protein
MLNRVAQNKYKLMACIIILYLVVDVLQHKGQTRVLFPENFAEVEKAPMLPQSKSILINTNKNWKKGINSRAQMNKLNAGLAGFECDVYFDTAKKIFDVHHDPGKSAGLNLEDLLKLYQQKKMSGGIWLDMKNLDSTNLRAVMQLLTRLRGGYALQNKILVESGRADLLSAFSDSAFYTSYYTPFFNPYKINSQQIKLWADSISSVIGKSKVNALSGYYFQCDFLHHYFAGYPVLTWVDDEPFSLVNHLFQWKISANRAIYIALKP